MTSLPVCPPALGFLLGLGSAGIDFRIAGALLVGGIVAAPVAAWLVRVMPARVLGVAAGGLIVLTNAKTLLEVLGASGSTVLAAAGVLGAAWLTLTGWTVRQERAARALERELETVA